MPGSVQWLVAGRRGGGSGRDVAMVTGALGGALVGFRSEMNSAWYGLIPRAANRLSHQDYRSRMAGTDQVLAGRYLTA
jgi:hypothetical protein